MRRERIEQRIADLGFRRLRVFLRREVVADASDIGEPSLRCLGQGAAERDRPVGMAPGPVMTAEPTRIAWREIADLAKKSSDADIRRRVPYPH